MIFLKKVLIKKSSEYIGFSENNEIIEALQNEIANLRTELLNTQKELVNLPLPPQDSK